ncbi:MAG: tyrosine-protein phosphatase [Solirubrobacteraceae bacterium]
MIDLHSHVLAGIDDGPATVEGSLAILRAAEAAGITTIVATPHVSSRYMNDSAGIAAAAAALADALPEQAPAVRLRLGAEIAVTRIAELDSEELSALRLGEGPWLLIEPPFSTVVRGLETTVAELHRREHRVLLAHPERSPALQRDPSLLEALVDAGVLTSLTSGSLVGQFGGDVRRFAMRLLEAGLVHNVASDAHDAERRPPSIAAELRAAGLGELEDWLTRQVPAAILDGGEIPRRPAGASAPARGRRWSWRGRRS